MACILETENLTKEYGSKTAVRDVNMHIGEGRIYGLIGRNGAGKTTIMRMISGLATPTRGRYSLFEKTGPEKGKMLRQVGVLIESPGIYPRLSAQDNLKIKCLALGVDARREVPALLKTVGLGDVSPKQKAGAFSLGMRQRLGIALALAGRPKLLVLDEPINGLDPQGIVEVRETLVRLRNEQGVSIMISSHILDELSRVADDYGIINDGELLDEFTSAELHLRSGKSVMIRADRPEEVLRLLEKMGLHGEAAEDRAWIRVRDGLDRTGDMTRAIVEAGIPLHELYLRSVSLEDYYLGVTGGHQTHPASPEDVHPDVKGGKPNA